MNVTFLVPMRDGNPDFEKMQSKIQCIDENGTKVKYYPKEIQEYQFRWKGQTIRMISLDNTLPSLNPWPGPSKIFLKLEMDGQVRMFRYQYTITNRYAGAGGNQVTVKQRYISIVLQKRESALLKADDKLFRYQMRYFFDDCPELVEKIDNGTYVSPQYSALVSFYNSHCVD